MRFPKVILARDAKAASSRTFIVHTKLPQFLGVVEGKPDGSPTIRVVYEIAVDVTGVDEPLIKRILKKLPLQQWPVTESNPDLPRYLLGYGVDNTVYLLDTDEFCLICLKEDETGLIEQGRPYYFGQHLDAYSKEAILDNLLGAYHRYKKMLPAVNS